MQKKRLSSYLASRKGLDLSETSTPVEISTSSAQQINIHEWQKNRSTPVNSARTTYRFYNDEKYCHEETAYLLLPYLESTESILLIMTMKRPMPFY